MAYKSSLSLNHPSAYVGEGGFAGLASLLTPSIVAPMPRLVTRLTTAGEEAAANETAAPAVRELTPRELDVLRGVAGGHSNKVIARQLHLTPETIKWHLKNIMRKLGVNSRKAAVERAVACGFLEEVEPQEIRVLAKQPEDRVAPLTNCAPAP